MQRSEAAKWFCWTGLFFAVAGVALSTFGIMKLVYSLTTAMNPAGTKDSLVDVVYRNRFLIQGPRIVVIGHRSPSILDRLEALLPQRKQSS